MAWLAMVLAGAVVAGDAMPEPLTPQQGDAARGRVIVTSRQVGLCLLCHSGPFPEERFQGTLAPSLAGVGSRWSEAQLRLRVADARRLNPQSTMPRYHPTTATATDDPGQALNRVAPAWAGKPVLDAQQVEDVVAFLRTLREPAR